MGKIIHTVRQQNQIFLSGFIRFTIILGILFSLSHNVIAQVVSPLQGGHYSPVVKNIRDMVNPPSGLFVLWYNVYSSSDKYVDRNGNEFSSIRLDQIYPGLPNINLDLKLKGFIFVPAISWASNFKVLGGASYMTGISPNYISADASLISERGGIIIDTTYNRSL